MALDRKGNVRKRRIEAFGRLRHEGGEPKDTGDRTSGESAPLTGSALQNGRAPDLPAGAQGQPPFPGGAVAPGPPPGPPFGFPDFAGPLGAGEIAEATSPKMLPPPTPDSDTPPISTAPSRAEIIPYSRAVPPDRLARRRLNAGPTDPDAPADLDLSGSGMSVSLSRAG